MKKEKKKFGDRRDARRCRDVNSMNQILIDLKPNRSLGELYINQKIDVTNLVKYMENHKEGEDKFTYFHAFVTAIAKTMYNRPLLNRFISNRHTYEHNELVISFVMKVSFNDKSEEIMVLLPIEENDNIYTISKKLKDKVNSIRDKKDTGSGANDAIKILAKLPNILRIPVVGLFKLFDKWGMLPASLVKDNIYYSSMIVSNVGTLKCDGIYHNITDFGTCSGIIVMGEIKEEKNKYYCEFGVTIDERIADGYYFIKSLKMIEYILNNPNILESSVNEKVEIEER